MLNISSSKRSRAHNKNSLRASCSAVGFYVLQVNNTIWSGVAEMLHLHAYSRYVTLWLHMFLPLLSGSLRTSSHYTAAHVVAEQARTKNYIQHSCSDTGCAGLFKVTRSRGSCHVYFTFSVFLPAQPPAPDDLSIVCFTSGTTGMVFIMHPHT